MKNSLKKFTFYRVFVQALNPTYKMWRFRKYNSVILSSVENYTSLDENEGIIYAGRRARKEKFALRGESARRLTLLLALTPSFLSGKKFPREKEPI